MAERPESRAVERPWVLCLCPVDRISLDQIRDSFFGCIPADEQKAVLALGLGIVWYAERSPVAAVNAVPAVLSLISEVIRELCLPFARSPDDVHCRVQPESRGRAAESLLEAAGPLSVEPEDHRNPKLLARRGNPEIIAVCPAGDEQSIRIEREHAVENFSPAQSFSGNSGADRIDVENEGRGSVRVPVKDHELRVVSLLQLAPARNDVWRGLGVK